MTHSLTKARAATGHLCHEVLFARLTFLDQLQTNLRRRVPDVGGRVVGRDVRRPVPQQELAILELNAGGPQALAVRAAPMLSET